MYLKEYWEVISMDGDGYLQIIESMIEEFLRLAVILYRIEILFHIILHLVETITTILTLRFVLWFILWNIFINISIKEMIL